MPESRPITAASPTDLWRTREPSTSAVPIHYIDLKGGPTSPTRCGDQRRSTEPESISFRRRNSTPVFFLSFKLTSLRLLYEQVASVAAIANVGCVLAAADAV